MGASVGQFSKLNMFGMLRELLNNGTPILSFAGVPVSGTSGTYVGQAGPGAILIDYTNANLYMNTNTLASPTWTIMPSGEAGSVLSAMIAPSVIQTATGQISPANIIGTSAGQLGHAQGVVLVPAAPAGSANVLLSAVVAMDFLTAAYTAGGNTTVNISGGGAALTGLVNTTTLIQATTNVIINLVPLAATNNSYGTGANGLALVTSVAPTNPGTAAGVINWQVTYQTIAGLVV